MADKAKLDAFWKATTPEYRESLFFLIRQLLNKQQPTNVAVTLHDSDIVPVYRPFAGADGVTEQGDLLPYFYYLYYKVLGIQLKYPCQRSNAALSNFYKNFFLKWQTENLTD